MPLAPLKSSMVYNKPIMFYIGMPYIIGKLLNQSFQCSEVHKRVTAYWLPASLKAYTLHTNGSEFWGISQFLINDKYDIN